MLDTGADVNSLSVNANTPLIQAAVNKHAGCVKILIDAGADVKPDDHYTTTGNVRLVVSWLRCRSFYTFLCGNKKCGKSTKPEATGAK